MTLTNIGNYAYKLTQKSRSIYVPIKNTIKLLTNGGIEPRSVYQCRITEWQSDWIGVVEAI